MAATRYFLAEQMHFLGLDGRQKEVVITIQSWKSRAGRKGIYVKAHNGVEVVRRLCHTPEDAVRVQRSFAMAQAMIQADPPELTPLSDDAAADEIARRGGPGPRWCSLSNCGAQVPVAASQCAEGHPWETATGPGRYVFGSNRRPALTVITGGLGKPTTTTTVTADQLTLDTGGGSGR
jgi:hypothetical protein